MNVSKVKPNHCQNINHGVEKQGYKFEFQTAPINVKTKLCLML